jgi:amino acid transporter
MNSSENPLVKKTKKSKFQKLALYFAGISIISAIASVIYLTLNIDTLGWENPISASLLASTFFFLFVALVFIVIGTANVPSFKVDEG